MTIYSETKMIIKYKDKMAMMSLKEEVERIKLTEEMELILLHMIVLQLQSLLILQKLCKMVKKKILIIFNIILIIKTQGGDA